MTAGMLGSLLLGLLLLLPPAAARAEPEEGYELVEVRRLAGVAGPAAMPNPEGGPGEHVFPRRLLLDGGSGGCVRAERLPEPPLDLGDPMLADIAWGLPPGAASGWRLRCRAGLALAVAEPDGRTLVAVTADGTATGLYEKPLEPGRIRRLQEVLRDRKFLHRPPSGRLDEDTLAALGFYLDYLGMPYRYRRPILTEALLRELGP